MNRALSLPVLILVLFMTACTSTEFKASDPVEKDTIQTSTDQIQDTEGFEIIPSGKSEEETEKSTEDLETKDRTVYTEEPVKIRLNVSQSVQETDYYCAVACLQMVLSFHEISMNQPDLAQRLNTYPITGTEYEDLAREASLLIFGSIPDSESDPGYRAVLWKRNEGSENDFRVFEQRVKSDLESGDPVFISINIAPAYDYNFDGVHEVVLYGADYDSCGNPSMYYFIDPSYNQQNPEFQGRKMYTPEELWKIMNDNPEPGYVW